MADKSDTAEKVYSLEEALKIYRECFDDRLLSSKCAGCPLNDSRYVDDSSSCSLFTLIWDKERIKKET